MPSPAIEVAIRGFAASDLAGCERVLRSLPEWFGVEESNREYVRDFVAHETLVAWRAGAIVGVATLKTQSPVATELSFLAVDRSCHRQGIGRQLLERIQSLLRGRGIQLLQVKTLGPSRPDDGYDQTRRFYEALGFLPLEETTAFWGTGSPSLIMIKVLATSAPRS